MRVSEERPAVLSGRSEKSPGAGGAARCQRCYRGGKRGEEEDADKRNWSSANVWMLLLRFRNPPPSHPGLARIASASIIMHKYSRDWKIAPSWKNNLSLYL